MKIKNIFLDVIELMKKEQNVKFVMKIYFQMKMDYVLTITIVKRKMMMELVKSAKATMKEFTA